MHISPCHNRVLIQEIAVDPDVSIIIPDTIESPELTFMLVLAIGPDVKCCQPGDKVLLIPNANKLALTTKRPIIGLTTDQSIIAVDNGLGVALEG